MNFAELNFKLVDESRVAPQHLIAWANALLEAGCNAPSIAELASCCFDKPPDPQQVERLFEASLVELNLTLSQDWFHAFRLYAISICKKTLSGELPPQGCIDEMLQLSEDHQEPYALTVWTDLAHDMNVDHRGGHRRSSFNGALPIENPDECIRRTASQFVSIFSTDASDCFPLIWWCHACKEVTENDTNLPIEERACAACGSGSSLKNMRFFENREAYVSKAASSGWTSS
jgi:hypothetical protein